MFEKVTVCHLLPQRTGAGDKVVAGKEANWHWKVSGGHGWLCSSPEVGCKDRDSRGPRAACWGEKEGAPVSKNGKGKNRTEKQKEGLKKGKSWMLHLREVQIWKSTHTLGHPHTLLLSKLQSKSCASMGHPKRVHLICSEREDFSKFPSIFHRNETEKLLWILAQKEKTNSPIHIKPQKREAHNGHKLGFSVVPHQENLKICQMGTTS